MTQVTPPDKHDFAPKEPEDKKGGGPFAVHDLGDKH